MFRTALRDFTRAYAFISQIAQFTDPGLEKLYYYGKYLLNELDTQRDPATVDLDGSVVLTHLRMEMTAREPGLEMRTRQTSLDAALVGDTDVHIDAYEELLLDVIDGDRSLFLRFDEVEQAWKVVDPVLRSWADGQDSIHTYPAGSWGPTESQRLFEREHHRWRHSLDPEPWHG